MALTNTPTAPTAPAASTVAFEEMPGASDVAVAEPQAELMTSVEVALVNTALAEPQGSAGALTLVQPQAVSGPVRTNLPLRGLLAGAPAAGFKDRFDQLTLENLGFKTFPRITIDNGGLFALNKTEKKLGQRLRAQMLSWNYATIVSCNVDNDPEARNKIRTSYDGVTLRNNEGQVANYVQQLRAENYSKASAKQYIEVYALLDRYIESDGKGGSKVIDIPEDQQEIHQISLPPTSVAKWNGFLANALVRSSRARKRAEESGTTYDAQAGAEILVMLGQSVQSGSNVHGLITFLPNWDA